MSALDAVVADALMLSAIPAPTGHEEARAQAFAALLSAVAGVQVRRDAVGNVLGRARDSVEFGLIVIFAIFCFRTLLRKDWIASLAAAVLFDVVTRRARR